MKLKVVATLTMNCLGEEHKILLLSNGHIHMANHDYNTEQILSKMGGELPVCCQFIKKLRDKEYYFSTAAFPGSNVTKFAERVRSVREAHQRRKYDLSTWERYPTIQERHANKLKPYLENSLKKTRYRRAMVGHVEKFVVYTGKNSSMWEILYGGCCCGCFCESCQDEPIIGITIDWTWQKVINRKIDVVDGFLVLKVLEETPEYYMVLAGHQAADLTISVRRAIIRRAGAPHLEWLPTP